MRFCIDHQLFIDDHFISIPQILRKLYPHIKPNKKSTPLTGASFFRDLPKKADFYYYKNLFEFSIAERNYKQQQYNIAKKKDLVIRYRQNRVNLKEVKKLAKQASIRGLETDQLICIYEKQNSIISGKSHVAELLNCSSYTGCKRLKKWDEEGRIARKIISQFVPCIPSPYLFDIYKAKGHTFVIPTKNGFILSMGSKIGLVNRETGEVSGL